MSEALRTLRAEPKARGALLERLALALLDGALAELRGGTLVVELPDGSSRRWGAGPAVTLRVHDETALLRRIATRGKLGLGESYQAGDWDADDLPALFELLLANADAAAARHARLRRVLDARPRPNRRNGLLRARRNIAYHYDLGNELFALMLDETMTYSCAIFDELDEPLEDAQRRKLRRVCERLGLRPGDRVLEIGCGWGSFALVAAGEFGAHVTGLTLSEEQAALARERVAAAGLADRVEIRLQDYRTVEGTWDAIASIEMLEAIGERELPVYFAALDRLLVPGGRACVQTILVPDRRWERYRKSPDWIERYVFPGCLIPSVAALTAAMRDSSRLNVVGLEEIGPHYAETLRRWRLAFEAGLDRVRGLGYDERFVRTWRFYLAFCEAGFRTRQLRDAQIVFARTGEA
jgi:cyclopropane-fatty-acyl-phospholipid synthase